MLKTRSFPDLYPLIRPPRRPLALGTGRIFIQGSVRSPPKLAVYDIAYCLPLEGAGRKFPFIEGEAQGTAHTSLVLLERPLTPRVSRIKNTKTKVLK